MGWKNQLTKTPYLVLFIILITVGVGTASALISITLSGDVVITGFLDMMGDKITNVGEPTASTDAATKGYVDSSPTTDTLAGLGCTNNQVAQFVGSTWVCVDKISDADSLDGIDSTAFVTESEYSERKIIDNLDCSENQIPKFVGSAWTCAADVDTNSDTLEGLSCSSSELARWNGASWECVTITLETNPNVTVDSPGDVGRYTSIAIGSDNLPVISYNALISGSLKFLHCGNTTCNSGNTITTVDNTADVGFHSSVAIGTNGDPRISYYDFTNGDLKILHCGNTTCNFANTITTVDSADNVGLYTSIAIGADGLPVISYYKGTGTSLKVIHCGNTTCDSGNTITTLDSLDNVGLYTSIAIGSDNLPVISYFQATSGDLKVVHCGNTTCSGGNSITTVDSADDVGIQTSIAIHTDGNPVISYYDDTNEALKFVHCSNISCSATNHIVTLDSTGNVGLFTSIAIGSDNNYVISYFDFTNGDLKLTSEGVILTFE